MRKQIQEMQGSKPMKKNYHQNVNPLRITLIIAGLVVGLALVFVILEKTHVIDLVKDPDNSTNQTGPTKEEREQQTKTDAATKQRYLDDAYKPDTQNSNTPPDEPETNNQTAASLDLSASQNGDSVTVLTKITGITDGKCTLRITNGSTTPANKEAAVIYQPEFSSCAGFSVPTSYAGTGTWSITVSVDPLSGSGVTETVTLEVK
ncbi:hypothetical protein CSA80_03555 [Candidatus Saccharibacteria bacterium]|nr:MAG: hypothetical protein CSA80_03555 [Candidatus Saccharibacteria bacterium]